MLFVWADIDADCRDTVQHFGLVKAWRVVLLVRFVYLSEQLISLKPITPQIVHIEEKHTHLLDRYLGYKEAIAQFQPDTLVNLHVFDLNEL